MILGILALCLRGLLAALLAVVLTTLGLLGLAVLTAESVLAAGVGRLRPAR